MPHKHNGVKLSSNGSDQKAIFDSFGSINYSKDAKSGKATLDNNIKVIGKDTDKLLHLMIDVRAEQVRDELNKVAQADTYARVCMATWLANSKYLHSANVLYKNGKALPNLYEIFGGRGESYDLANLPQFVFNKTHKKREYGKVAPHVHSYMESVWGDVYCLCGNRTSKSSVKEFIPIVARHTHKCSDSCTHGISRKHMPTTKCGRCNSSWCKCGSRAMSKGKYMKAIKANGHGMLTTSPIL